MMTSDFLNGFMGGQGASFVPDLSSASSSSSDGKFMGGVSFGNFNADRYFSGDTQTSSTASGGSNSGDIARLLKWGAIAAAVVYGGHKLSKGRSKARRRRKSK